ncbi:hypothetical protein AMJ44_09245 [candidate division WOR-1 bacterium DG_54_3]|uniref:Uncharacterized protein n=1 Tax=candidate division WOR-1 bacterium DG_54_3 TaxID=1703775 RepID=A0A0S7XV22_UNCSA|nr:MAG: hypothetical protein AMJ44_09245 [candidate division WOR-1 bacterium DG_54_3]
MGDVDYMHIVSTEGKTTGGNQYLAYQRCYLVDPAVNNTNMICETPDNGAQGVTTPVTVIAGLDGCGSFCNVAYFGVGEPSFCPTCGPDDYPNDIAIVAVSSPVSKKVALVFLNKKVTGDAQWDNDVFYTESDSNGYEWFPQYGERAYTEVQACYDYEDNLHIVWTSCQYDPATGTPQTFDANLMHWVNTDPPGINNASIAVPGYWDDLTYGCGSWNRNISKFAISAKPPEYHPDSVFLFCTWTQFRPMDTDPPDQSVNDFANGEIYGNVSQDGGQTWSRGYNLTGTKTPGCDPNADDPCLSEHWSSLAEYMYNGDLHIQYICDRDAGGAIQDAPSIWTENPVMYLHFKQLPTVAACDVNIQLTDPPASWCYPPLKVLPGETRSIIMKLRGLFTLVGSYEVTTDNANVVCNTNCSGQLDPQEEVTVELLINCPGGEGFIAAKVFVDYCQGTDDAATDTIDLHVVQSDDYWECPRDTIRTTIWKDNCVLIAWFCANCEQQVWDKRVEDPDGDNIQPIFSAGPIVATTWAGDTVVGRQDYSDVLTGARDTLHHVVGQDPDQPECASVLSR